MNMRLFIAINFNDETRLRLLALRDELRGKSQCGNYSAPENLHLTLAFIGEVSPKKVDAIKAIMGTVTFTPFSATIYRLGTFSHGTLWWAGLCEDNPLMDLQREATHKLALCGFEMDGRKYNPHINTGVENRASLNITQKLVNGLFNVSTQNQDIVIDGI